MKRSIAWVIAAGVLSACGSATDHVSFQAPPAYKSVVSVGPFMQMWAGEHQNVIMLMALPTKFDLDKAVMESPVKGATVEKESKINICGGQEALFLNMVGNVKSASSSSGANGDKPQQIEFLTTNVNGKTYMAMYIRPKGSAPDTSAETAIKDVCPK